MLNRLTYNVKNINDFSKLPTPFLCVATDIETGKQVVLKKGYLAQCLLASSAFPTLYAPVEIDGRLLVDGGVSNNYPVEEIKKMGADIVVGVDVQDNLKNRKDLKEATNILLQISNIQMMDNMQSKIKLTDIYIKPDISKYNVVSFNEKSEIILKGEEAAKAVYDKIKELAKLSNFYKKPDAKKINDTIQINDIQINGANHYTTDYVLGKLRLKPNEKLSFSNLSTGISTLNATQNFSSIHYKIIKNDENKENLVINLTENPNNGFLKLSLHYDPLFKSGVLTNYTRKNTLFKNDVVAADVILGDNFRFIFYYYIDNGFHWSFGLKSKFSSFNKNIQTDFNNGILFDKFNLKSININFDSWSNQIYTQTVFRLKSQIGFGLEYEQLKIKSETLQSINNTFENSNYLSAFGFFKFDSYDNKYFPKKGVYFNGDFQTYLFSSNFSGNFYPFSIAKAELGYALILLKKTTLKFQADAGSSIGNSSISYFDFVFGGYGFAPIKNIKPFYGYDFLSFSANSFIKSTAIIDFEVVKKNHINLSVNLANTDNKLFKNSNWLINPKYSGYALGYGLETILGPIEVKYSWSPEINKNFVWATVGFWF